MPRYRNIRQSNNISIGLNVLKNIAYLIHFFTLKEKLKKTMGLLKELGQSIPIVTLDSDYMMTCNHFYLKNLVTELETMFKNQVLQSEDEK